MSKPKGRPKSAAVTDADMDRGGHTDPGFRVAGASLRVVAVADIGVDRSYQRGLVPKHRRIAAAFNPTALGIPLVAQRADGSLWVVDGQQRLGALKIQGVETVRAEVFASKGAKDEAEVFRLVNSMRTKMSSKDEFFALLTAEYPPAVAVADRIAAHGFTIPKGNKRKKDDASLTQMTAVKTLLTVLCRQGVEAVDFILATIRDAWPHDLERTRSEVVYGLWYFWVRRKGQIDRQRLVARLRAVPAARIAYQARNSGVGNVGGNAADAIERAYQKRSASAA